MNQIAIGDPIDGFYILEGASITVPFFKATLDLSYSPEPFVKETIAIELKGTPTQIQWAFPRLESIVRRTVLYEHVAYPSPQYLRFRLVAGGDYYYTPISQCHLSTNPAGYKTQQRGSLLVYLHYTRPNYFDGPNTQVSLSGRAGTVFPGWYPLMNATETAGGAGSSVLINKANFLTALPAPLRFEYMFNSGGAARAKDIFVGIFDHPTYNSDVPFFAYYNTLAGGTEHADSAAIEGYFRRVTWTSPNWIDLTKYLIDTGTVDNFNGASYRPILHLFSTHLYNDLYFRVQIERFGSVLYVSEPIHSKDATGYIVLPPVEIPPNFLLREQNSARVQVCLYARRLSGATTTVEFDCLTLFPLAHAASFYGFVHMQQNQVLIDDTHRSRHNVQLASGSNESVSHSRLGGPLLLSPLSHCRVFFYCANHINQMPKSYAINLKCYYRPRIRLL